MPEEGLGTGYHGGGRCDGAALLLLLLLLCGAPVPLRGARCSAAGARGGAATSTWPSRIEPLRSNEARMCCLSVVLLVRCTSRVLLYVRLACRSGLSSGMCGPLGVFLDPGRFQRCLFGKTSPLLLSLAVNTVSPTHLSLIKLRRFSIADLARLHRNCIWRIVCYTPVPIRMPAQCIHLLRRVTGPTTDSKSDRFERTLKIANQPFMRKHPKQLERYPYHPIQMLLVKYNLTFAMYSLCFC